MPQFDRQHLFALAYRAHLRPGRSSRIDTENLVSSDNVRLLQLIPAKWDHSFHVANPELNALSLAYPNVSTAFVSDYVSDYRSPLIPRFANLVYLTLVCAAMQYTPHELPPFLLILRDAPRLKALKITFTFIATPISEVIMSLPKTTIRALPFSLTHYSVTAISNGWLAPVQCSRSTLQHLSVSFVIRNQWYLGGGEPLVVDELAKQGPFPALRSLRLLVRPTPDQDDTALQSTQGLLIQCPRLQRLELPALGPQGVPRLLQSLDALLVPLMHLGVQFPWGGFANSSWPPRDEDVEDICCALPSTPTLRRLRSFTISVPERYLRRAPVLDSPLHVFCTARRIKLEICAS